MVKKITDNNIGTVLESRVAIVDFSAQWCGPCRMLAPILEELSEELSEKAEFFNADVDENPELAIKYGITNIPALMVFKQGEKADFSVGFMPKNELKEFIENSI